MGSLRSLYKSSVIMFMLFNPRIFEMDFCQRDFHGFQAASKRTRNNLITLYQMNCVDEPSRMSSTTGSRNKSRPVVWGQTPQMFRGFDISLTWLLNKFSLLSNVFSTWIVEFWQIKSTPPELWKQSTDIRAHGIRSSISCMKIVNYLLELRKLFSSILILTSFFAASLNLEQASSVTFYRTEQTVINNVWYDCCFNNQAKVMISIQVSVSRLNVVS